MRDHILGFCGINLYDFAQEIDLNWGRNTPTPEPVQPTDGAVSAFEKGDHTPPQMKPAPSLAASIREIFRP